MKLPQIRLKDLIRQKMFCFILESSNLMVFLISKRDLFQFKGSNGKSNLIKSNIQDLLLIGGIELLFSVVLSPPFVSPFIRMEFTAFREITISDHQRLAMVDLKSCFTAR